MFGCVRLVYSEAGEYGTRAWGLGRRRVFYRQLLAALTGWKKTEGSAFLGEVSSVPLVVRWACPLSEGALYRLSARLGCANQMVVFGGLTVWSVLNSRSLARAVSDVSWVEFWSVLEYEASW